MQAEAGKAGKFSFEFISQSCISWFFDSIALYYISLLIGFGKYIDGKYIDDQIRNPNVNNRDHLVGRPTRVPYAWERWDRLE